MNTYSWKHKNKDWELFSGVDYVGLICTCQYDISIVADDRQLIGPDKMTLAKCKRWLVKWHKIEAQTELYKEKLWGKK